MAGFKSDSIGISIFVDILDELTNTVTEITIQIVRRAALSIAKDMPSFWSRAGLHQDHLVVRLFVC